MAGNKTSVWLGEDLWTRWKESGLPLAEVVRRGLDAGDPEVAAADAIRTALSDVLADHDEHIRAIVREELERIAQR